MHAHDHDGDMVAQRPPAGRPDPVAHTHVPEAMPAVAPSSYSPNSVLRMQRLVGNRAITSVLATPVVQRCGPTPCGCGPAERAEKEAAMPAASATHDGGAEMAGQ